MFAGKSTRLIPVLGITLGLCASIATVSAHHVPEAKFDPDKPMQLRGSVSKIDWLNPHVHLFMEVEAGGATTSWAVELESTLDLRRNGWTSQTLKPGDVITV